MRVRYVTTNSFVMFPPLMGSLGRPIGASMGKAFFFESHL